MAEPTTEGAVSVDAQLADMEQAVNAQAGTSETAEQESSEQVAETQNDWKIFQQLAEKKGFKSPDDLAKSYMALESRSTKAEQSKAGLEQQLEQIKQLKDTMNVSDEQERALQILEQTVEKALEKRLRPIEETIGVQKVDKMVKDLQTVYPDFTGSVVDQTLDYMVDHRGVSMEDAFKIISWEQVKEKGATSQVKQAKEQEKSRAFVESASSAKSDSSIDYSKLSLDELEDILPAAGQYVDYKGRLKNG